jgi:integrase
MRQALGAAVRWHYLSRNPAVEAGKNPEPPQEELLPFTREQVEALADELGPLYGSLVLVAAETGLRTNEWIALERRDLDREGRAVTVQRRYAGGVLTPYSKTAKSRRRVPLTARALDALDSVPPASTRRSCSRHRGVATSSWTRGGTASGIRRSTRPGSRSAGPTTCATRPRPRRSRRASRSSSSPG